MNPTNIRDPDIPVTLGAFRALQDEVRRLDAQVNQLQTPAQRLVKWLHCMSYNDSYFGEPTGYLKQCVNELRHLLPPKEMEADRA